ncbi:MAG: alkaline phosphatase [Prevotellaceae bacterium]|nr:alkaline phosphatase [Prevotellaceae bacterium]
MLRCNKSLWFVFAFVLICFFAVSCSSSKDKQPKYVFYLIGDGMGLAQVSATEAYLSELEGKVGGISLPFTQFPVIGVATTFSANRGITCSSAAGTALATGIKTKNNMLGMDPDTLALKSIAYKFKEAGYKVGITTSVGVNHATPAAFYGHQDNRSKYYEIGLELPGTGFDFFAGASMMEPNGKMKDQKSLYEIIAKSGYGIAYGAGQYDSVKNVSERILLVEKPEYNAYDALAYAIDRKGNELTLPVIVEKAIDFLGKDTKNDKGFFLMIEGGKIDWSSHSNDGGTTIQEVMDFSATIDKVIEFYDAHPNETLIVITADHETGGMSLASKSGYILNAKSLKGQKISKELLSARFHDLSVEKGGKVQWDEIRTILANELGFWNGVELTEDQENELKKCYNEAFVKGYEKEQKTLYSTTGAMANVAMKMLNDIAKIGWTTNSHSGIPVPVYAKGAGSSEFAGKMDNTDIPKKIIKATGISF